MPIIGTWKRVTQVDHDHCHKTLHKVNFQAGWLEYKTVQFIRSTQDVIIFYHRWHMNGPGRKERQNLDWASENTRNQSCSRSAVSSSREASEMSMQIGQKSVGRLSLANEDEKATNIGSIRLLYDRSVRCFLVVMYVLLVWTKTGSFSIISIRIFTQTLSYSFEDLHIYSYDDDNMNRYAATRARLVRPFASYRSRHLLIIFTLISPINFPTALTKSFFRLGTKITYAEVIMPKWRTHLLICSRVRFHYCSIARLRNRVSLPVRPRVK